MKFTTLKEIPEQFLLPARIRIKDKRLHLVMETKHPITREIIRHSESTGIIISEKKREQKEKELEAFDLLMDFRKKWTKFHLKKENITSCTKEKEYSFIDFMRYWYNSIEANLQPSTSKGYKVIIERKIVPYFAPKNISLRNIKPKDIQDFYTFCLQKEKLNPNTVLRYHANIRKALQLALKQELIFSNPADLVERPKKSKHISKILSPNEIFEVLDYIKETHLELPTFMAMYYGLRRGEALGLLWSDVDFENKKLTISNSLIEDRNGNLVNRKKLKTKASHRTLELLPEVEKFLLKLKKQQTMNKIIFGKSYNNNFSDNICIKENGELIKLGYVTQRFTTISRRMGFRDISFHSLRHSFATNMYNGGMDMKQLQAWLGHSVLSTTMDTYAHLLDDKIKESVFIIRDVMKRGRNNKKNIYINSNQPGSEIIK